MGEARLDEHWSHTASILALIANVNRDPKKTGPFKPSDFSPTKRKEPITGKADISMLKSVFVKQQPPTHTPRTPRTPHTPLKQETSP